MPSNIVAYEWPLNNSIHIAYESADNHIHEMRLRQQGTWRDVDITRTAGGPQLEDAMLTGSNWSTGKTQQIAYTSAMGANGHIYELVMYQEHPWSVEDIMAQPIGAAPADGLALVEYDWQAAGAKVLIYTGSDSHIHELRAGTTGLWQYTDLTQATNTPLSENALIAAYAWETNKTNQVVYVSGDGHIHELVNTLDGKWQHTDVTYATNSPVADGSTLIGYAWEAVNTKQIVYTRNNGDIYELVSGPDGKWTFTDITSLTQASAVAGTALAAYAWETGEAKSIVYVDAQHHIQELQKPQQGQWQQNDLTSHLNLPHASVDVLDAHEWTAEFAKHIAYLDTTENPHIHSLLFKHGGQWEHVDVTSFTGAQSIV